MPRLLLAAILLLSCVGRAAALGAPVRRMLGQYPLPNPLGEERFQTGSLRVGHFFDNDGEHAAARPDGSGTAYNLYQINVHDAMQGGKAGFIGDLMFLSDRERPNNFNFTQWGYLLGLVFKGDGGRLQFSREEQKPLDRGGRSYRYWDIRAGFDFDSGGKDTRTARKLSLGTLNRNEPLLQRLRGVLTLGYFLHNESYPARVDLTGKAALRYHARGEVTLNGGWLLLGEAQFISEKRGVLDPVSLEGSYGVGFRLRDAQVAFERHSSDNLDRPGFAKTWMLTFSYPFDSRK